MTEIQHLRPATGYHVRFFDENRALQFVELEEAALLTRQLADGRWSWRLLFRPAPPEETEIEIFNPLGEIWLSGVTTKTGFVAKGERD